jgi:penicillin-binding protein 1A
MKKKGFSEREIFAKFKIPTQMKLFSWKGEIDTLISPNDSILYGKNLIRSSVLSIEPSSGHVKAWVGGIDFDHFPFDLVKSGKRQMGSTMKPFLYSTAISMGVVKPCTELTNDSYCVDPCDPGGRKWCPSGSSRGTVRNNFISTKGMGSIGIASKMGACTGPQSIAKLLEGMNIEIPEDQIVPSMCLGTPDVSLFNLVAANAMFVNNGVYISPQTVLRIEDRDGNEIYVAKTTSRKVLNPTIAFEILQMMKDVVQFGVGSSLRGERKWGGIKHPTAAIAGTTQGNSCGWFIGLTPDLVTGVWGGGIDKQVRFRSMLWGQGSRMALPVYGYFMQGIYADESLKLSTEDFKPPISYDPKQFACSEDEASKADEKINPFGR